MPFYHLFLCPLLPRVNRQKRSGIIVSIMDEDKSLKDFPEHQAHTSVMTYSHWKEP